jgi:hypothetical protein
MAVKVSELDRDIRKDKKALQIPLHKMDIVNRNIAEHMIDQE